MSEVTVIQADRDAAADYLGGQGFDWGVCGDVRHGRAKHDLAEAFARHRIASRPSAEPGEGEGQTFEEAWAEKETQGYRYGRDALENVRFGWEIAMSALSPRPPMGEEDKP